MTRADFSCHPKDSNEQEGGVSLVQREDEKIDRNVPLNKEEKKRRKKEKRLREEALRQLMENGLDPLPNASGLDVEAGGERIRCEHF